MAGGIAKEIFAKMSGEGEDMGESSKEAGPSLPSPGVAAAKRFMSAAGVKGDPSAVYDAFKALVDECKGEESADVGEV
jgi:hypothetical protein